MSVDPSELPDYGAIQRYDHVALGNTVLWPLVSQQWGKDWLEETFPGNELKICHQGFVDGSRLEARLTAETISNTGELGNEKDAISVVSIVVDQYVDDARKEMLLSQASTYLDQFNVDTEEYSGQSVRYWQHGLRVYPDNFNAIIATIILMDTVGNFRTAKGQVVKDGGGIPVWDDRDTESQSSEEVEAATPYQAPSWLHEHHMELLGSGLVVFNAPQAILHALDAIRQNPIT